MSFDALTLPVSNKDLAEFSDTCACLKDVFFVSFKLLQHSVPFYALNDFFPRKS